MLRALGFPSSAPHKLNVVARACYLNTPETEGKQKVRPTAQETGSCRATLGLEEMEVQG